MLSQSAWRVQLASRCSAVTRVLLWQVARWYGAAACNSGRKVALVGLACSPLILYDPLTMQGSMCMLHGSNPAACAAGGDVAAAAVSRHDGSSNSSTK